ncbi:MAG TPA: class I SAM-dependent methyltransferase [Roseiarcus sp.]|nr:class I SAM-dependent methyltransferase [Roseiarcus sp.]
MSQESAAAAPDRAGMAERARQAYDLAPYQSVALMRLHPARLAACAKLAGLAPPPISSARVLEIGCASGGHIIPLAYAFPNARFVGVDVSPRQIADGKARIDRLGLANIELAAQSFAVLGEADGDFDVIVAHGLYSWIPEPLRDDLLRVCGARLAPNGLALISYNVLPGWRMFEIVRDSMILHAGGEADQQKRSAKARRLFAAMKERADLSTSYGRFWRDEAQRMTVGDDAYLTHEVFEDSSAPSSFRDFTARAQRFGLAYACESRVRANRPETVAPDAAAIIEEFSGGDGMAREQYIDIFSGRTFRESILIRADEAFRLDASDRRQRLAALHMIAPIGLELRPIEGKPGAFVIADDAVSLECDDPAAVESVRRLIARRPSSSRFEDLASETNDVSRPVVLSTLWRMAEMGLLDVSTEPVACAEALSARPRASALATSDAKAGDLTATLRHAPFHMDPLDRLLLARLDGARSRDSLVDLFVEAVASGGLRASGPQGPIVERKALLGALGPEVDRRLANYARIGLLAPD